MHLFNNIDSKLTVKVDDDKKEALKAKLGQAIGILGKTESYLMVGFEDDYTLYMGGKKLDKGASERIEFIYSEDSRSNRVPNKSIVLIVGT